VLEPLHAVFWEPGPPAGDGAPSGAGGGELQIWRFDLDSEIVRWPPAPGPEPGLSGLSPEERARAERFRFDHDRSRFVAGRRGLRRVLARYCGAPAGDLTLDVDQGGKPRLREAPQLSFNYTRSGPLGLCAVAPAGTPVGIDVERLRPIPDAIDVAETFFAAGEAAALRAAPEDARSDAFLRSWTRKEAYLKGLGVGLGGSLSADVDPSWRVETWAPDAGYVASVAVRGGELRRRHFLEIRPAP
jgi:4'-phosphopantetheinyl transferase